MVKAIREKEGEDAYDVAGLIKMDKKTATYKIDESGNLEIWM